MGIENDMSPDADSRECPYLPRPRASMSYRDVRSAGLVGVDAYYLTNLHYGHFLWRQGHGGRATLALTRALYADVAETASVLQQWPLPYAAIGWVVRHHSSDDFPGNPRISFQHQATRMRGHRNEIKRARAWAVWSIIRVARPSLPADTKQAIKEPQLETIEAGLRRWGHCNESSVWRKALES